MANIKPDIRNQISQKDGSVDELEGELDMLPPSGQGFLDEMKKQHGVAAEGDVTGRDDENASGIVVHGGTLQKAKANNEKVDKDRAQTMATKKRVQFEERVDSQDQGIMQIPAAGLQKQPGIASKR